MCYFMKTSTWLDLSFLAVCVVDYLLSRTKPASKSFQRRITTYKSFHFATSHLEAIANFIRDHSMALGVGAQRGLIHTPSICIPNLGLSHEGVWNDTLLTMLPSYQLNLLKYVCKLRSRLFWFNGRLFSFSLSPAPCLFCIAAQTTPTK